MFVERCAEDLGDDDPKEFCWHMMKSMYGTRPAAQDWAAEVKKNIVDMGIRPGRASLAVLSCCVGCVVLCTW